MNWNPLYPSDEEVGSWEEAMREAEWEDSLREIGEEWQKSHWGDDEAN